MDHPKSWLTSGAFAGFCGTTKETLRHYKDIGLLSPAHRGENGYFYYDVEQFYDFYAISILRQTGTPLGEIRRCLQGQSAAATFAQLEEQRKRLEEERKKLEQMDFILSGILRNLELGIAPDLVPRTARFEKEHLLALPVEELERRMPSPAGEDERLIAVLERCQELCRQYGMQTDFQLGAIHLSGKRAEQATISHLYTRIRERADCPYYWEKPAGNYLYLCCRGRWDISEGYAALDRYLCEQGLETAGNVYVCDLAGFVLNGLERNAVSMLAIRLVD
ncbi:MAG: MerR family transcriptional regulator [Provencibacterium sp.]|jgi:DNA-binding transcriptional MerR regulator|nr:MerR family transcriptional regulator [Provencibacterium sp.]